MASPPFSIAETEPGDGDVVSLFPNINRDNMDVIESWLTAISDPTSGHPRIPIAASPSDASYPTGALVWDSDATQLYIRLTGGFTIIGPEFPSGTRMVFQQTSAPAGWTKVTDSAYDDAIAALTTGTIGTTGTVGASNFLIGGDHFENNDVIGDFVSSSDGAHTHTVTFTEDPSGSGLQLLDNDNADGSSADHIVTTSSDGAHTHTGNVTANSSEIPMFTEIKVVTFIVAQKD